MIAFMAFVLLPFVVMCGIGAFEMHPYDWWPLPKPTEVDWVGLFNVAYWSVTGFDCCSTFAHEIDSPRHRILPNALFWSVGIMLLGYLLPLGIGAAVDKDWHSWTDGSLTHVAQLIGGNWLGLWVLLSTLIGTWGQFGAELFEDSYQLLGMAEVGLIPRFFSIRWSLTGTPIAAMMLQVLVICVMVGLNFNAILVIDNFFATAATILEFASLIKLRISDPDMPRPYAIPMGTYMLCLLLVPTFVVAFALLWVNITASMTSAFVCIGGLILGILLYIPLALSAEAGTIGDRLRQIEAEDSPRSSA
jgi:amino acid transporter